MINQRTRMNDTVEHVAQDCHVQNRCCDGIGRTVGHCSSERCHAHPAVLSQECTRTGTHDRARPIRARIGRFLPVPICPVAVELAQAAHDSVARSAAAGVLVAVIGQERIHDLVLGGLHRSIRACSIECVSQKQAHLRVVGDPQMIRDFRSPHIGAGDVGDPAKLYGITPGVSQRNSADDSAKSCGGHIDGHTSNSR
jgi:hypothetical protein